MLDGQNLFDEGSAFSNEWRIDETLDSLDKYGLQVPIVIGIDNGGVNRLAEYTVWENSKYQSGKGKEMGSFIVDDLIPKVNKTLRVKKSRKKTIIGGSSLGGLMSFYMLMMYTNTFSGAMVYSPAFWINPEIYDWAKNKSSKRKTKLLMVSGADEHSAILEGHQNMENIVKGKFNFYFSDLVKGGNHSENFWGKVFPTDILWLFCRNCD